MWPIAWSNRKELMLEVWWTTPSPSQPTCYHSCVSLSKKHIQTYIPWAETKQCGVRNRQTQNSHTNLFRTVGVHFWGDPFFLKRFQLTPIVLPCFCFIMALSHLWNAIKGTNFDLTCKNKQNTFEGETERGTKGLVQYSLTSWWHPDMLTNKPPVFL